VVQLTRNAPAKGSSSRSRRQHESNANRSLLYRIPESDKIDDTCNQISLVNLNNNTCCEPGKNPASKTPMKNRRIVTCAKLCTPANPIVKIPQSNSNVASHLEGRTYLFMIQLDGTSNRAYATAKSETAMAYCRFDMLVCWINESPVSELSSLEFPMFPLSR
jgi:hypothetical protein